MRQKTHPPTDLTLARLAERQHGVASLAQLHALGLGASAITRRTRAGRLHRLYRGVYAVGHRRLTVHGRWLAATLACGAEAVLSHVSALALWDLRPIPSGRIHVTVPARGRRSDEQIRVHCVRELDPRDRARKDAIPVTTVARALLDYADGAGPQQLRLAVEAAERRDLLDGAVLDDLLRRSSGRCTARLQAAVTAVTGPAPWTQSELENRFLALVRTAGLPEPQANVLVNGFLVDFCWPEAKLIVEVDGYAYHRGRARFEEDRRRDAALQLAGYRVLRITQKRLREEPARVAAEIRALLEL